MSCGERLPSSSNSQLAEEPQACHSCGLPPSPDPTADRGVHDISFAIMPHTGFFQDSGNYWKAMALVSPVTLRAVKAVPPALPTFMIRGPRAESVYLETVKLAEDSDAVILRMYEALGVSCGWTS